MRSLISLLTIDIPVITTKATKLSADYNQVKTVPHHSLLYCLSYYSYYIHSIERETHPLSITSLLNYKELFHILDSVPFLSLTYPVFLMKSIC